MLAASVVPHIGYKVILAFTLWNHTAHVMPI
jgi:hypothetical protein